VTKRRKTVKCLPSKARHRTGDAAEARPLQPPYS
jgi:hypothetical protein